MVEDHLHLHLPLSSDSNPIDWSMVVIRHHPHDNTTDCSVFPPTDHENLQIFPHSQHPPIPQSPHPPPPSDFDALDPPTYSAPFDSQVGKRGDFVSWMTLGLRILRSKFLSVASSFRNGSSRRRGAFWSFWVPAAAVVMSCWIFMRRRKRRFLTRNETCLLDMIKERDARIAQLLHQIAQMNEILIAHHKTLAAKVAK